MDPESPAVEADAYFPTCGFSYRKETGIITSIAKVPPLRAVVAACDCFARFWPRCSCGIMSEETFACSERTWCAGGSWQLSAPFINQMVTTRGALCISEGRHGTVTPRCERVPKGCPRCCLCIECNLRVVMALRTCPPALVPLTRAELVSAVGRRGSEQRQTYSTKRLRLSAS